ncbi:MAG: transketolase C-terminal domain-containing protein [archaeon]
MSAELLNGNQSVAWAVRRARVNFISSFTSPFTSEIFENLANWIERKDFEAEFLSCSTPRAAVSSVMAASAGGSRSFTALSSVSIAQCLDLLYNISSMRLPVLVANCSSSLGIPLSFGNDHSDFLLARDSGWFLISASTNQEIFDSILMQYKISESTYIPSLINYDSFLLSHTSEVVQVPSQKELASFLKPFKPEYLVLNFDRPVLHGVASLSGDLSFEFRKNLHDCLISSKKEFSKVHKEYYKLFGRKYDFVEHFHTEDSEKIIICMGAVSTSFKQVASELRGKGKKVGILRLRILRPFPFEEITKALKGCSSVVVVDQAVSFGKGGILSSEILENIKDSGIKCINVVAGLGGKVLDKKTIKKIFEIEKEGINFV